MSTLNSRPEEWDLEIIANLEDSDMDYCFDTYLAFKHKDGRLFWAHSSGCSCPDPFEEYDCIESLNPITKENWEQFKDSFVSTGTRWTHCTIGERHDFITEVKKHLAL